jgi:hypothetical protein
LKITRWIYFRSRLSYLITENNLSKKKGLSFDKPFLFCGGAGGT